MAGVIRGSEALSGSHTTGLLVAEGLARRGHDVGLWVVHGQRVIDCSFQLVTTAALDAQWRGADRVIWLSYGDASILDHLSSCELQPIIWTHLPVTRSERGWLESGRIAGVITVSDTCRMPLLRSGLHCKVGRIYNPLPPVFSESTGGRVDRYGRRIVVYAGAAGPTKGLHRLLEMWRIVHRLEPGARLVLAGTGKLYGTDRRLGGFGLANPEFEAKYVKPLADEFGSLAQAGIDAVGLLNPAALRDLYESASVGVVNMNWVDFTETFCCAATEMMATGLPVFGVNRGALPETIGRSGGAVLTKRADLRKSATEFLALLRDPARLDALGRSGREFVRAEYDWGQVIEEWERAMMEKTTLESVSGRWRGQLSVQYFVEFAIGRIGAPWLIEVPLAAIRMVRRVLN